MNDVRWPGLASAGSAGDPYFDVPLKLRDIVLLLCLVAAVTLVGIPFHGTVPRVDEWDFVHEFNTLPISSYLLRPNPAGQFNPLFKALYGVLVFPFSYSNLLLGIFAGLVRAGTLLLWFLILRRIGCLSKVTALLIASVALSYVGMVDVFLAPVNAAEEITLFCFTAAVFATLQNRLVMCLTTLLVGSLCWGSGCVPPISILLSLLITLAFGSSYRSEIASRRRIILGMLVVAAVVCLTFVMISRPSENSVGIGLSSVRPILHYFLMGGIVNGALSGIAPMIFPASIHLLFFATLTVLSLLVVKGEERWERKFVVLCLLLTQVGLQLLIALTRWHHGHIHASSYRYVYLNVFLELPLAGILLHLASDRVAHRWRLAQRVLLGLAVVVFGIALVGGVKGRSSLASLERTRQRCLSEILAGSNQEDCLMTVYYRSDGDFIRSVWRSMGKGLKP